MTSGVPTFGFIGGRGQSVCMEHPDLVQSHLGGERVVAHVGLGGGDAVLVTPTRTLVYRAEGLLSDESVTEYPHNVERLSLKQSRRKTKFVLEYVDGTESFTVPNDVSRDVLGLVMQGVLSEEGIIEEDESVPGAFRFSELTLVVCGQRVVKHVGNNVWEQEFETFAYEDLTGLEFEKASVATEVVLRIDGRPARIKTPNDQARVVEQTIKKAVFEYFDVASMEELQAMFDAEAAEREGESDTEPERDNEDIGLKGGGGIDPLVDDDSASDDGPFADPLTSPAETAESEPDTERTQRATAGTVSETDADQLTEEDIEELRSQISRLTEAVNRQNEVLREQQQTIKQLVSELRQGR